MHRAHRHERTGESHEGSIPTISFDFFYTKADGQEGPTEETPDWVLSLIIACSATGFTESVGSYEP